MFSARVQAKMATYLVDVFRDKLITEPLKTHPIEQNCPLPSPNDLKYKILIKNKKRHHHTIAKPNNLSGQSSIRKTDSVATTISDQSMGINQISTSPPSQSTESIRRKQSVLNEIRNDSQASIEFDHPLASDNNRNGVLIEEDDNSSDEDEVLPPTGNCLETNDLNLNLNPTEILSTNSDVLMESKATKAMSDLVHYIVPVSFITFAEAEKKNRSYEISSFVEDKAQNLIRDYGKEFVAYNQRQLSRIYPRGTRFDSSNYNPYLFWPVGCQMVALNYQTLGNKNKKKQISILNKIIFFF
jgi:phosphatidylinositol phospholipase C beta